MSRIGKMPIIVPADVKVTISDDNTVSATGKLGSLSCKVENFLKVELNDNIITISRPDDKNESKAKHGLFRMLVANIIKGVNEGYKKSIVINGVGYKATKQGNKLVLNIGFSHPVEIIEDSEVKVTIVNDKEIEVSGIDKQRVGQFAAKIRDIKPVEPYHLYGIRYKNEVVVKKEGKSSSKKK